MLPFFVGNDIVVSGDIVLGDIVVYGIFIPGDIVSGDIVSGDHKGRPYGTKFQYFVKIVGIDLKFGWWSIHRRFYPQGTDFKYRNLMCHFANFLDYFEYIFECYLIHVHFV